MAAAPATLLVALLAPATSSAFTSISTDKTARGGTTDLALHDHAATQTLHLQGSLGALEGQDGTLVGFAIASAAMPADTGATLLSTSTGFRLSSTHEPPELHWQVRLVVQGLPSQYSYVASLPPASSAALMHAVPWTAFRLQYRGMLADGSVGFSLPVTLSPNQVVTHVGIELTRSSQPAPWNTTVPLPFRFVLHAPGIEAVGEEESPKK